MSLDTPSEHSERRQATVLFADISGFTLLSERLDPEELTAVMDRCFKLIERAILQHGGTIDKYIGDCVMGVFGVPVAIENAPRQAVNAAIEIRNVVTEFVRRETLPVPLDIHAGINTGLVVAGLIGGEVRRQFTVVGDPVNLASRLTDASPPGQILVGAETYYYTRGDFEYRGLEPLSIKGKSQPVQAYELLSRRVVVRRSRVRTAALELSSPMIGRESELASLEATGARLAEGEGAIASVIAEAGIGKSRLVTEALATSTFDRLARLEARALSIGSNLSFHPFVELFRAWAAIGDDELEAEALAKLAAAIDQVLADEAPEVIPFIATLMGMHPMGAHARRIEGIGGDALERLIVRATRRLLKAMSSEHPLVLWFEDLHWADVSSVRLLEALLGLVEETPILFLLVFRPHFTQTSERVRKLASSRFPDRYEELRLGPLPDVAAERLLECLLETEDLPHEFRRLICTRAEGNPFYIQEVIRWLIDHGAVERRNRRLTVTDAIYSVAIPGTIQEVILTRVDALDEGLKTLLQVASVIGRSFYRRVVADVLGEHPDLEANLAALRSRDLILERRPLRHRQQMPGAEVEYVFKHALLQETVYESLLQRTRKDLHRRVARSIESAYRDRLADFHAMLAYHYTRAEDPEKAEEYLFKAGDEAARSAASGEAVNFFREASRLYLLMHRDSPDPRKEALLEKNIGLALLNRGDLTDSIGHFDRALDLLGEPLPKSSLARQWRFALSLVAVLARFYAGIGRRRRIKDWDREREVWEILFNRGRAEITSDPVRLFADTVIGFNTLNQIDAARIPQASAIYRSCGMVFCYSGISFDVSKKALARARQLRRSGDVADAFNEAVMEYILHYLEGDWQDRYIVPAEAVAQGLRYGQLWDANNYVGLLCDEQLRRGNFAEARALLERLAEMDGDYGYEFAGVNRQIMSAILLLEERKLDEALALADAYQGARHELALKLLGLGVKAKIQVLLDDLDGSATTLEGAEKLARRWREIPPWHLSAFAVARLRHDVETVERELGASSRIRAATRRRAGKSARYAISVAAKVAANRVEIQQQIGRLGWLLGRRRRALRHWKSAVEIGTRMRAVPELSRTYAEAGRLLGRDGAGLRFGRHDARACLDTARSLCAQAGLDWHREHATA